MSDRKLTINDKVWKYRVGKNNVVITYPDGKKKKIWESNHLRDTEASYPGNGMIKPSDVKNYILTYCRIQK